MREGFLISNLFNALKKDKKLVITNKSSKRDFLYIDDFVDLILKIKDYTSKLEIFNVGSGISFSFEEIIKKIENNSSKKLKVDYEEDESFIEDIRADISKIKKTVNWQPKIKLDDALKKFSIY